ncbi:hypothetical protein BD413DRAFT_698547 [Trametes elegans]|nr:hypothetical protein BD413DRAFT_698547 [Trametes elegans]
MRALVVGMDLDTTVGSVFIGYTVSLWLYGITLSQVGLFFHNNRNAPRSLKAVVWALLVLDNAQTIVLSHGIWLYVVPYRSWPQGLDKPPRSFGIMVYITSLNNLIVRCVFAYRIYKLSGRRILLPLVVTMLSVTVSVLACAYGTQGVRMLEWDAGRDLAWMFYTGYACEFAADFLITSAMVFTFARRSIGLRRTKTLTQTLMIYFLNTGLLVMICVICSTIAYLALPDSFAFLAFYLALGKRKSRTSPRRACFHLLTYSLPVYANTLLGSLNARDVLFPRASRELPQTTAPLLTSVVVLDDDNDDMFATTAQENRDTGGGSSFESDETRAEREKGKTKDAASVQEIETVEADAPPTVETRDASARINSSKLDRQSPHPR